MNHCVSCTHCVLVSSALALMVIQVLQVAGVVPTLARARRSRDWIIGAAHQHLHYSIRCPYAVPCRCHNNAWSLSKSPSLSNCALLVNLAASSLARVALSSQRLRSHGLRAAVRRCPHRHPRCLCCHHRCNLCRPLRNVTNTTRCCRRLQQAALYPRPWPTLTKPRLITSCAQLLLHSRWEAYCCFSSGSMRAMRQVP